MSKFHQLTWTLSVVSSVLFLYYFFPYFTVSVVLLALGIYLYIDYESQQPQTRSHHLGNRPTDLLHAGLISKFRTFFREVINNLSAQIYRPANINLNNPSMPSANSYIGQSGAGARSVSGYISHSNLNRDENVNSPRLRSISRSKPVQSSSFDGFHALSPILRRDSSNAAEEDFNRLSISQLESSYQVNVGQPRPSRQNQSYIGNTSYNTRPLMDSSRDLSSIQKRHTPSSASRNVQTFAGPLLASTRYNLSSESALFADANSPGLSSRLAKYSQDVSDRGQPVTHQAKYSGPGQFPTVHLGKTSRLPVLSSRNTQKLARTPVRLRMAPPEPEERSLYALSDRSQALGGLTEPPAGRSVLDTLHDMSRKRLHAQLGDTTAEDDEGTKKLRRDRAASHKRSREASPLDDDQANKRTRSNEILSSLSSSRHIGVKRKTTGDTSGNGVTMPADKVLKKSVPSPVATPSTSMEQDAAPSPATPRLVAAVTQTTPVVPPDTQVDDAVPMVKPPQEAEAEWLRRPFMTPTSPVVLNMIHSRREEDAKNRLKTMMSAIGGKDKMFGRQPAASTTVVPPSSSTSTATTAAPTPPTLTTKSPFTMKHVHFADNLTQVNTYDVPTPETSSEPSKTVLSFPATAPSFGSVVSAPAVVTTSAATPPSLNAGFKLPSLGTGFTLPSLQGFGAAKMTSPVPATPAATGFGGLGGAGGALNPSTGFTMAIPTAVTSAPTLAPTAASPLPTAFGAQATTTTVGLSSGTFATSVPSLPTLGQIGAAATVPVMSSGFGKSVSSPSTAFGFTAGAASTAASPPTFGQGMTFGTTNAPSVFGQATTTVSPLVSATGPTTTFGAVPAPSASTPAFGAPTTSAAPPPAYSSGFGDLAAAKTEPPKLFGFGATTQPSSMAAPTKPSQSGFGGSIQFGAKVAAQPSGFSFNGVTAQSTTATAPSVAPPSYSASTKTSAFQFGGNVGVPPASGFGAAQPSKPTVFGASPASVAPSTNGPSATPGTFSFGSTASKPFAFGDASAAPSLFGGAVSAAAPVTAVQSPSGGFGSGVFASQPGVNASNLTQVPIQQAPTSGLFNFGGAASKANGNAAAQPAPAASFSFGSTGAAKPGGFSFGAAPQASAGTGGFNFSAPASQSAPTFGQTAQPTSTFGQTAQTMSAFGQTTQPTSTFGQTAQPTSTFGQTAQPTSAFGQTAQPTSAFGQTAQPSSTFGQTAQPTSAFGQSAQPPSTFGQSISDGQSTGGFQFGSAAAPPGTGGFNFGGSATGTAAPPSFGAGMQSNVFQMGAPAAQQAPGMFSIGTGSTGPRGRTGPRSRRR